MKQALTPPIKAVAYVRVSSAAQVKKGQGAESQAARCAEYARMKNYQVVRVFDDKGISGSLVERPGMQQMLSFLRQHPGQNIRVLIDDISRLARSLEAHLTLRAAIGSAGGVLESPSIEFGEDSDSELIEHMLASVAAHGRRKNAEQTRHRMEARLRSGYWPFLPCIGFKYEKREGHGKVLVRKEPIASIIQEGLEGYASGRFQTQAEVARFFAAQAEFPKNRQGKVRNQLVNDILTRPLYAGLVERPQWGVARREGKHDGLISVETFQRVQDRLAGRAYAPARANLNEDFILRGAVICADCGNALTACWSRGKMGTRYPYYLCHTKGCVSRRKSIPRAKLEGEFEAYLKSLVPSETLVSVAKQLFAKAWDRQLQLGKEQAASLKQSIDRLEREIVQLLDRILSASSARVIETYERRINELESEKLILADKAKNAGKPKRPFEEMFELALGFLANPCKVWEKGDYSERQTVIRLCLTDRLVYDRDLGVQTPKFSNIFNIMKEATMRSSKLAVLSV